MRTKHFPCKSCRIYIWPAIFSLVRLPNFGTSKMSCAWRTKSMTNRKCCWWSETDARLPDVWKSGTSSFFCLQPYIYKYGAINFQILLYAKHDLAVYKLIGHFFMLSISKNKKIYQICYSFRLWERVWKELNTPFFFSSFWPSLESV